MTNVDEINSNDCYEMDKIEFIEFFARLSEIAALPPVCKPEEETDLWTYE